MEITACSAGGRRAATCRPLNPPHEIPIIPTAPLHHGCSASQAMTSSASSRSWGRYSSSRIPSESPVPRRSTRTPAEQRCALVRAVADGITGRHLELAAVASLETGKSRAESIAEVQEAVDLITTYADHMESNDGYVVPLASFVERERNYDVLRPYGVFAVIAPFNFPAALSVGMASAALIAGNTVVFKPSEETPWTGAILEEIVRAADLPPGVFNLVHGGEASGKALVAARVDGVA